VSVYRRVWHGYYGSGLSKCEFSSKFGLHRDTFRKILQFSVPPGYLRKNLPHRPKLSPFFVVIDSILEPDKDKPRKQRHTAKRLSGDIFTVESSTGYGQVNFGEALGVIGGIPLSLLYDTTKFAVGRIEKNGNLKHTKKFDELLPHYLFEARFGRPGRQL
jgi:hypothetical protein